jgi:hypothetical protein
MATSQGRNEAQLKEGTKRRLAAGPVSQHPALEAQQADPDELQRAVVDPTRARPADILALQRATGNRAVSGLLVQAKLVVGPVGDRYEQEAERAADQVMRLPILARRQGSVASGQSAAQRQTEEKEDVHAKPSAVAFTPLTQSFDRPVLSGVKGHMTQRQEEEELQMRPAENVQRQEEEEEMQMQPLQRQEEEEELQATPAAGIQRQEEEEEVQMQPLQRQEEEEELQMQPLQRQEEEEELQMQPLQRQEEEEELQGMPAAGIQRLPHGSGMVATPDLESAIKQERGGGQSLADGVREPMEQAFGADFSGVRVHTDKGADALNRSLQAKAFTTGNDIFFRSGTYQPGNPSGQRLLAHELTHTMQQGASTRIARWAPLGTSHSNITKQALSEIEDHEAKKFYKKRNIRSFIRKFAEDMDNREKAKPGWEQIKALFKREYPVYKKMGRQKGPGGQKRSLKERQQAWLNIEGYSRDRTEQVNHAETGMYKLGADEGSARDETWDRINAWYDLAVKEGRKAARQGAKGRWNDAFMYLGLALHTIEDIGAHGYGIPGKYPKGHDPRRFVKPPPVPEGETRPEAYDLYLKGASFGDCDKRSTNRAGHREAVTLAKNQLEHFAAHFAGITPKLRKHKLGFMDKLMGRKPKAEWSKWKQFYYPTKQGRMVYTDSKKGRKAAQREERRERVERRRQQEQLQRELRERLSSM